MICRLADIICLDAEFLTLAALFLIVMLAILSYSAKRSAKSIFPLWLFTPICIESDYILYWTMVGLLLIAAIFTYRTYRKDKRRRLFERDSIYDQAGLKEDIVLLNEKLQRNENEGAKVRDILKVLEKSIRNVEATVNHMNAVLNNNTREKLMNVVEKLALNPMVAADAGMLRYFQIKVQDVYSQYERIKLMAMQGMEPISKLASEEFIKSFVGGGSAELRMYYSYKVDGELLHYPEEFLKEVDSINFRSYQKFLDYYRDNKFVYTDTIYCLQDATIRAFKDDVGTIYAAYLTSKTRIKDPQIRLSSNTVDVINNKESVQIWKNMIAEGDHNIPAILRIVLKSNIPEHMYNLAVVILGRWNEVVNTELGGGDVSIEKNKLRSDLLTLIDKIN